MFRFEPPEPERTQAHRELELRCQHLEPFILTLERGRTVRDRPPQVSLIGCAVVVEDPERSNIFSDAGTSNSFNVVRIVPIANLPDQNPKVSAVSECNHLQTKRPPQVGPAGVLHIDARLRA